MKRLKFFLAPLAIGSLACGGLFGSNGKPPTVKENPDKRDLAEQARLMREYIRADALLKGRIAENPNDHHAYRLLGDVNLTRGADYRKKWKENLARAVDAYSKAVTLKPDDCIYWARLAGAITMSYPADATRVPPSVIEDLPLKEGWKKCSGAALLEIQISKEPTEEEYAAAEEQSPKGDVWDRLAIAAPWIADAWRQAPQDQIDWTPGHAVVPVQRGLPFVVLDPPLTAKGQGHSIHRPVAKIEKFTALRASGNKAVFVDRRFPERIPSTAVVRADACKHTAWNENGDGRATGTCTTGTFLRRASPLYNPSKLRSAGPYNFRHPSIKPSIIPSDEIITGSVKCTGGPVGKKLEYTPSCPVAYDKPNWLTRWLPLDKVTGARDAAHAEQLITAGGMKQIWGEGMTHHMVNGDFGVGMSYSAFRYHRPDLKGCLGRALLNRHIINGGQLEFTCILDDTAYSFVDLQLVWFGPKAEYKGATPPTP